MGFYLELNWSSRQSAQNDRTILGSIILYVSLLYMCAFSERVMGGGCHVIV